ncbi:hypothetical protein [Planotetraspora sp. GP83]|uniref:hypothetical protein n=1 Tax=Planotetraspora sp. GP83 TaxID=3156264 RepID=UPI00351827B7
MESTLHHDDPANSPHRTASGPGRWLALITTVVCVVLALLFFQTPPGQNVVQLAGLADRSDAYTELSFSEPENLPKALPAAATVLKSPFVIQNRTGTQHAYTWTVEVSDSQGPSWTKSGSVQIADDQRAIVSPLVRVNCRTGRVTIGIRLDSGEGIHHGVACTDSGSGDNG